MNFNDSLPGTLSDQFSVTLNEHTPLQREIEIIEKAGEMGFFDVAESALNLNPGNVQDFKAEAYPQIKSAANAIHVSGVVNMAPQPIELPDSCKFIGMSYTGGANGRCWVVGHENFVPDMAQTITDAIAGYPVAIIGTGPTFKYFPRPVGLKTIYVSSESDSKLLSVVFYCGDLELKDIL